MGVPVDYKSIAPRAPDGDFALETLFPMRDGDLDRFLGAVVDDREAFDRLSIGQGIEDEVH